MAVAPQVFAMVEGWHTPEVKTFVEIPFFYAFMPKSVVQATSTLPHQIESRLHTGDLRAC